MHARTNRRLQVAIVNGLFLLAGALVTGLVANWDKIIGETTIEAPYSGYKPTSDFQIETRYFMDISGMRQEFKILVEKDMEALDALVEHLKSTLESSSEADTELQADELDKIVDITREERTTSDEFIATLLSVYEKYYTIEEIQELNKFFSTDIMRAMVSKNRAVWEDLLPALHDLNKMQIGRLARRMRIEFPDNQDIQSRAEWLESIAAQQ